jgi:hypothetical protein
MTITDLLLFAVAGFSAGTVGSMLGVGGGMILIPLLTHVFEFHFEQARATSLLAVIATSTGVAAATGRERFGNLRLSVILSFPTVAMAFLNAWLMQRVQASVLYLSFAGVLAVAAVLMWRPERTDESLQDVSGEPPGSLDGVFSDPKAQRDIIYRVRRVPALFTISAIAGGVSGLLGVGGGVFQVPAMSIFGGVPMRAATATSNFLLGITAAASLPLYLQRGDVRPLESAAVVMGVLGGAFAGAAFAKRIQGSTLRRLFTIVLGVLIYQMIRKAL